MKKNGEWGEFFSITASPFAYNETVANIYYPLTEEEVKKKGYKWLKAQKTVLDEEYQIPDSIKDVDEKICEQNLKCESCNKGYKIIKQEFSFYKKMGIPIPRKCFLCRYKDRMRYRTVTKLTSTKCAKCSKDIMVALGEYKKEKVFCEKCYLEEVY